MKEITRIHIAKVAYDIEVDAKKELEKYIAALERYASDPEILGDIEIRITELLAEQGVAAGGVITGEGLAAVRAQLGEPSDFASESAADAVGDVEATKDEPRRVYRDEDNAVLGGVLAGFGRFFGIDPLWVRLLFIVILLGSFGTALIVYLLLWLIIPPANTAADKLRMSGKPVTLAAIKELAGSEGQRSRNALMLRRVLGGFTGLVLVLLGIAGLIAIVAVIVGLQIGIGGEFAPEANGWMLESWWFMTMIGLFVLSGLLFSALCFTLASAVFRRQWTKHVSVAVIAIIAAGLVAFAGGVGAGMYGYTTEQAHIMEMRKTTSGDLPADFQDVKQLTITADSDVRIDGPIQYHVSDNFSYELDSLPGIEPRFEVSADGLSATVKLVRTDKSWSPRGQVWRPWHTLGKPVLRVYGPVLDSIEVESKNPYVSYENDQGQGSFAAALQGTASLTLGGKYEKVNIKGDDHTVAVLDDAVVGELRTEGGRVTAGVVRLLDVRQPDVCADRAAIEPYEYVKVRGVSGEILVYNGTERDVASIEGECGKVVIGSEREPSLREEW